MKLELILLISVCVFSSAMIPRERRALETEGGKGKQACAHSTPCAWMLYRPISKQIYERIYNTYCVCSEHTTCQQTLDDKDTGAYVYHCGEPSKDEE